MFDHGSRLKLIASLTLLLCLLAPHFATPLHAIDLPSFSYSQNFDGIGTATTATLPTDWRVSKDGTVRTVGSYAAATTATELVAGNSMSSSAANGIYNYGAGVANSAADRAVGWISSGMATRSGNLYVRFTNTTGSAIQSLNIAYDVEKYRGGSNAAGFSIQLYYSTDGATWTSAGPSFLTNFGADAANTGFASAPGTTTAVAGTLTFPTAIANNADFYLAWNYSVTSGTTTSNAQGLGIDNFQITGGTLSVMLASLSAVSQGDRVIVAWETVSELNNQGFNLYRATAVDGPRTLLNSALIPAQRPGSSDGAAYTWTDSSVSPGSSYFYWLEDVDLTGARTLHAPVSVTVADPTAITLSTIGTRRGAGGWPWLLVGSALLAGAILRRQGRRVVR